VRHRPIENLNGWTFNANDTVTMTNGKLMLRHIQVHCATRETSEWDQPILHTLDEQIIELLCRSQDGVLEFAFCPRWEPGLVRGAELGPTFFRRSTEPVTPGIIRARVRQSDEGSRFYHTTADYRIVEVTEIAGENQFSWLRLSEVQATMVAVLYRLSFHTSSSNRSERAAISAAARALYAPASASFTPLLPGQKFKSPPLVGCDVIGLVTFDFVLGVFF